MPKVSAPPVKPKQTTETDHHIGSRIALLRSASGMSQSMLAEALGISFQQVQKYEAGKNRIGAGRLHAIADRLGVPVAVFFAEERGPKARGTSLGILQEEGALMLLQAYETIPDETVRREIVTLVKVAASLSRGTRSAKDRL